MDRPLNLGCASIAIAEADDGFVNGEEAADGVQVRDGIEAGDSVCPSPSTVLDLVMMEPSIPALEEGDYSVAVSAFDADGNETPQSAQWPLPMTIPPPVRQRWSRYHQQTRITIPDADDGVVDETESDGVDVEVTLPETTQPGDTITVTVTDPNGDETEIEGTVPTNWDGQPSDGDHTA